MTKDSGPRATVHSITKDDPLMMARQLSEESRSHLPERFRVTLADRAPTKTVTDKVVPLFDAAKMDPQAAEALLCRQIVAALESWTPLQARVEPQREIRKSIESRYERITSDFRYLEAALARLEARRGIATARMCLDDNASLDEIQAQTDSLRERLIAIAKAPLLNDHDDA